MEKIVEIDLSCSNDLLEKYNKKVVSIELIEYLVRVTPRFTKNDKIKIVINSSIKEELNVLNLIKEGLKSEYQDNLNIHYRTNVIQFIYLVIGVLILFLSTFITTELLKEVILIGGWVFIWALVELEIFTDIKGRNKRRILLKLINSEMVEIKK